MRRVKSLSTLVISLFLVFHIILIVKYFNIESPLHYVIGQTEMAYSKVFVVPNVLHFIRFGNSTLTFMDAVCILAALKNQKPQKLFLHTDQVDFDGGKYWQVVIEQRVARGVVQVRYLPQPRGVYGKPFSKKFGMYHKSDTERLRILWEYGGIYLDNDLFIVKSLNQFRHYEMTLGWENGGGISDQIIIAAKNARFLKVWLESYKDYRPDSWFYNGGDLPTKLLQKRPYLVHRVEKGLAEWRQAPRLIYYELSQLWTTHYAIHLLIRHQQELLITNLTQTATYPVEFNETNILEYEVNIKYMALSVYPLEKEKRKAERKRRREIREQRKRLKTAATKP